MLVQYINNDVTGWCGVMLLFYLMQPNPQHLASVDRPLPQPDITMESSVEHKMWPEGMEDEPTIMA